jgi:hypothetical protein
MHIIYLCLNQIRSGNKMIDEKLCLQIFVTFVVGVYVLNKMLWETYKTYEKQRTRDGLLELNWTFGLSSKK